jgi:hypothetical protein
VSTPGEPAEWTPANETEQALALAVMEQDLDTYLSVLAAGELVLPVAPDADVEADGIGWPTVALGERTAIVVYTSDEAYRQTVAAGAPVAYLPITTIDLAACWPDPEWMLAVAPGIPLAALVEAADLIRSANPPLPDGDLIMQKAITEERVGALLAGEAPDDDPADMISGYVHAFGAVADLDTPAALIDGLGLERPGSGFTADADHIHVLRWQATIPRLYRPAIGGRDSATMQALGGWIVDDPPFRGTGFAASKSELIREFRVNGLRLPNGSEIYRLDRNGREARVGVYTADLGVWLPSTWDDQTTDDQTTELPE